MSLRMRLSLVETANREIRFDKAANWAGLYEGTARARGSKVSCPFCFDGGGRDPAFRVYEDHGYCFAGCGPYDTVRLLAEYWQLPQQVAAEKALNKVGWRPPTVENLWKEASAEPDPDRGALEVALRSYCASLVPDWEERKYTPTVAGLLSVCLGALPLVQTQGECVEWLSRCKTAMAEILGGSGA